jgi:hypothetical protein
MFYRSEVKLYQCMAMSSKSGKKNRLMIVSGIVSSQVFIDVVVYSVDLPVACPIS